MSLRRVSRLRRGRRLMIHRLMMNRRLMIHLKKKMSHCLNRHDLGMKSRCRPRRKNHRPRKYHLLCRRSRKNHRPCHRKRRTHQKNHRCYRHRDCESLSGMAKSSE